MIAASPVGPRLSARLPTCLLCSRCVLNEPLRRQGLIFRLCQGFPQGSSHNNLPPALLATPSQTDLHRFACPSPVLPCQAKLPTPTMHLLLLRAKLWPPHLPDGWGDISPVRPTCNKHPSPPRSRVCCKSILKSCLCRKSEWERQKHQPLSIPFRGCWRSSKSYSGPHRQEGHFSKYRHFHNRVEYLHL